MKNNYNEHMKQILKRFYLLPILIVCGFFFSCSRAEPIIHFGFIELILYPGNTGPVERYSFFILPEDEDGLDNLDELFLYHDREGLRWRFSHNDWVTHEEDGITWIGSRSIAMQNNAPLPRGLYRAVLVNLGGESTERLFSFDSPETPRHSFPAFSIANQIFRIESTFPVNHFIGYDIGGNPIQTVTLTEHEGDIRNLRFHIAVRTIALWADDPMYRTSALTDAISIR